MIRGLRFTKFKGSEYSGHYGHAGRPGQVGGSVASGTTGYVKEVLDKAAPYLHSGDVSGIKSLSEDDFLKIEGTTNKDSAFYNTVTRELVLNEFQMALQDSQSKKLVIAHEVGHAVGDRLSLHHEEEIIRTWEPYASSFSGPASHSASEGFAEMFAMNLFDKGRLKRILGIPGMQRFSSLLEYSKR